MKQLEFDFGTPFIIEAFLSGFSNMENSPPTDSELGVLRQLLHREQAFFDIELQQSKLFEKDSFDAIKKLIFLNRKVFSLHLSILEQKSSGAVIDVPDLSLLSHSLPPNFSATFQRVLQTAVGTLLADFDNFAQKATELMSEQPESENFLVFSLIPSLFSCLWSLEESNRYIELIFKFGEEYRPSLTRLFLVHPSFFVFLSSIQSDAVRLLNSEETTIDNLLDLFCSRVFLFPTAARKLIMSSEDHKSLLITCVMTPLLTSPSLYGLLPGDETRTFESLIPSIESCSKLDNFIELISEQGNTIQMQPNEADLASILLANEPLIYLLPNDCSLLQSVVVSDIKVPRTEGVYQVPCKRPLPIQIPTKQGLNEEDVDAFETLLRSLVIQLDVAHAGANIIDTLEAALMLHAGSSRLQYELRLDEFKQMKKQREEPDEVSYYVQMLTSAYEQRMKHRKATLSNFTANDVFKVQHLQSTQAVNFLLKQRQITFFQMWNDESQPFEDLKDEAIIKEMCETRKPFYEKYRDLINQFVAFTEGKHISIARDQIIPLVYNKLTGIFTLETYRKYHPELVEQDIIIQKAIAENKELLYNKNNLPFLNTFKQDPNLMALAADHLRHAFEENSIIPIAEWINQALQALINVLGFQGYKEIGADFWLPSTLLLYIHVDPSKVMSVASYLHHFALTMPDWAPTPLSQSIEYNATMAHSAASYFQKEFENLLKKSDS